MSVRNLMKQMSRNSSSSQDIAGMNDDSEDFREQRERRSSIGMAMAKGAGNKLGLREKSSKQRSSDASTTEAAAAAAGMSRSPSSNQAMNSKLHKPSTASSSSSTMSNNRHKSDTSLSPKASRDKMKSKRHSALPTTSQDCSSSPKRKNGGGGGGGKGKMFFMRKSQSAGDADKVTTGLAGGAAVSRLKVGGVGRTTTTTTSSSSHQSDHTRDNTGTDKQQQQTQQASTNRTTDHPRSSGVSVAKKHQSVMDSLISKTTSTISAPANVVKGIGSGIGNAVVASTKGVVSTTQKAGHAVNQAGRGVRDGVRDGTMAIVDGTQQTTKALVNNTTSAVHMTTSTLNKGARGLGQGAKGLLLAKKNPFRPRSGFFGSTAEEQKSKWETSVNVIDELLDPTCEAFGGMTEDQRERLADVKKLLLKGPTHRSNSVMHVPRELIQMRTSIKKNNSGVGDVGYEDMDDMNQPGGGASNSRASRRKSSANMQRNSTFILQEYAGVKNTSALFENREDPDDDDDLEFFDASEDHGDGKVRMKNGDDNKKIQTLSPVKASDTGSMEEKDNSKTIVASSYVPEEFAAVAAEHQKELVELLSWESIGQWNFDIFRLNEITNGHPLLFMGWAILASPYAQQAMAAEIGIEKPLSGKGEYTFFDELRIPPEKLCNYIRIIEQDYNKENPYHNAIHASDVLQSLHALIQHSLEEEFMKDCPQINLFSILLSAIVHDVDHPGKTNGFYVQLKSELAVMYNDRSVLENWHVAHAFARMFDLDLTRHESIQANEGAILGAKNNQNSPNNILCNATPEQFLSVRKHIIEAVLHTDMTNHFESVNAARGMLMEEEGTMEKAERTWRLLMFMLHLADISGQAKGGSLFLLWTDRCMEEFFQQGDEETKLDLPISPNCDRKTVIPSESQVGFIQFVIEPAYEVLGMYIPYVQEIILPQIHSNHAHWVSQSDVSERLVTEGDEDGE